MLPGESGRRPPPQGCVSAAPHARDRGCGSGTWTDAAGVSTFGAVSGCASRTGAIGSKRSSGGARRLSAAADRQRASTDLLAKSRGQPRFTGTGIFGALIVPRQPAWRSRTRFALLRVASRSRSRGCRACGACESRSTHRRERVRRRDPVWSVAQTRAPSSASILQRLGLGRRASSVVNGRCVPRREVGRGCAPSARRATRVDERSSGTADGRLARVPARYSSWIPSRCLAPAVARISELPSRAPAGIGYLHLEQHGLVRGDRTDRPALNTYGCGGSGHSCSTEDRTARRRKAEHSLPAVRQRYRKDKSAPRWTRKACKPGFTSTGLGPRSRP